MGFLGLGKKGPEAEPRPGSGESLDSLTLLFRENRISVDDLEKGLEKTLSQAGLGEVQLRLKVNEALATIWAGIINDKSSLNPQSPFENLNPDEVLILRAVSSDLSENGLRELFINHQYSPLEAPRMVRTVNQLRKLRGQTTSDEPLESGEGSNLYTEGAQPLIEALRARNEEDKPSQ